ncbi:hypothetical protein [Lysobacter gummosus]|uniref:hypothetical protein n=1 Tax=Lysobacter gummosus TaxID=262324 RepID=UPI003638A4B4
MPAFRPRRQGATGPRSEAADRAGSRPDPINLSPLKRPSRRDRPGAGRRDAAPRPGPSRGRIDRSFRDAIDTTVFPGRA